MAAKSSEWGKFYPKLPKHIPVSSGGIQIVVPFNELIATIRKFLGLFGLPNESFEGTTSIILQGLALLETEYKGETTVIMTKGFGCLTERQLVI